MRRTLLLLALALPLLAAPTRILAQPLIGLGGPVMEADLLFFAGRPLETYQLLLEHYAIAPDDYDTLWRIARAGVTVGVGLERTGGQNGYLDTALHFARLAVERRPEGPEALYWRGAAAGRRALHAGPGYAAELAQLVYDDAHALLAADSLHPGAHNMLGKLNFEVMSLSRVERLIARTFMGNDALATASWEGAEAHLARAAELSPDFTLYQYDLAALYEKRGREAEAVDRLERTLALPAVQPLDPLVHELAEELLQAIRGN